MIITLRKAGISDIPALITIERSVAGAKIYSPMLTEGEWTEALRNGIVYVVENVTAVGGIPSEGGDGFAIGDVSYEVKNKSRAEITGLAIMPDFQGKGIGKQVMGMILEELKNVEQIELVVHPDNGSAIRLYESLGFKKAELLENYFGDGEPRIKMVLIR